MEYKVGDKVRIVRDVIFNDKYHVGDVGEVKSTNSDGWIELAMADGGVQCVLPSDYGCIEKVEENTMKYKVGDKVRVREWQDMAKEFGVDDDGDIVFTDGCHLVEPMRRFCGKTVVIGEITTGVTDSQRYVIVGDSHRWRWNDSMFESLKSQLIIEHHGRTTVAHIGKTYGVARCNPDDKYDAMTGDILAVQRLYAKKAPKKKIIGTNSGMCYGVIGEPSPFKDVDGNPLKVGDCVNVNGYHRTFIACNEDYGFFVMGWGLSGKNFNFPLRKVDDYDHEYFPNFKVIPCQQ